MKIIETVAELKEVLQPFAIHSIGLVPTMGALHEGHATLIQQARQENDVVVVSIFVNPTQFGPNEDFDSYPRDLDGDAKKCEDWQVDFIFAPSVEEIYGSHGGITYDAGPASRILCGASRPGHFNGVLQIVSKLFMLVQPTRAYFGQKDAQQLALIETLVRDYYFPLEIVPVPIVREEDGLAKSSRNVFLTPEERQEAVVLSQALTLAKARLQDGEEAAIVLEQARKKIEETSAKVEYLEYLAYPDLQRAPKDDERKILMVAIRFSNVRLIDNELFD